jgi:hypothetical protein
MGRVETILFCSIEGPGKEVLFRRKSLVREKYWSVTGKEVSPSFHSESVCEASMILRASLFLKLEGEISKFLPHMCILQNSTVSQSRR